MGSRAMALPKIGIVTSILAAVLVSGAALAEVQGAPNTTPDTSGSSGQQQNDSTTPDMGTAPSSTQQQGCPPVSFRRSGDSTPVLLSIADSTSDCGDMPTLPGWPKPHCPVDPNKPGGAREQACAPNRQS